MSNANKLRFYIDQAIIMRDYAALAVFEDRLAMLEDPSIKCIVESCADEPLSEAPVWRPDEFTSR
ncbi:MAG: hypothetical protein QGH60_07820 [Phycisphaerae bacterium]|nr:hypothetical protein [Phycisphaerae bacterium]